MKVLILFFCLVINQIYGQNSVDSILNIKTTEFKLNKINDFFYFETYSTGTARLAQKDEIDCSIGDSDIYMFWRKNNQDFIQKVSRCKESKIKISKDIIDFYSKNLVVIKDENIERYKTREDSVIGNRRYSFIKMVSHSCFSKLYMNIKSTLVTKTIDEFNLTNELAQPNINYDKNSTLKMIELVQLCEKIIKRINMKKQHD